MTEESAAMMRTDEERERNSDRAADSRLWRQCRDADAPDDGVARLLDLAAFADGRLIDEERDRVAALLDANPDAAADVQAAQMLCNPDPSPAGLERIVARACHLVPGAPVENDRVVAFPPRRGRRLVHHFAQWGSLAAALVLASWLGFALGTDTSLALGERVQPSDAGFLPEMFDPTTSLLRDLDEGSPT
jgi:hypothetical protein